MKKILLILSLMLFAISCSSSKSNVPDDNNTDSDNSVVNDEVEDTKDEDNTDLSDEASDAKTDEVVDETADEAADETSDEAADEVADETADETTDETSDETPDNEIGCAIGHCEIEGDCFDDGTIDTLNKCNVCDVATNEFGWSPVVCGDNEVCNQSDGTCGCDEASGYFLSPDETFCAFAGTKVVPTGQTKCYDATDIIACPTHASGLPFFGQDAQYTDNPRTLTIYGDSPDRVVIDSLTGLRWELDYDNTEMSWADAKTFCSAKGSNWRLPTLKELMTTLNFDHYAPACDTTYCPGDAGNFWSRTEDFSLGTSALNIYMYTGDIRSNSKTELYRARCVKGTVYNPSGTLTSDEDPTEPVVTDSLTGLSWTKSLGGKNWEGALDSCEKLDYGGHTDWRLPNVHELHTVMEYSSSTNGVALPNVSTAVHMTSTTYVGVTSSVIYFSFSSGRTSRGTKGNIMDHVCVR